MQSVSPIVLAAVIAVSCAQSGPQEKDQVSPENSPSSVMYLSPVSFDYQGHRGCRGLFPENSLPGFMHALDLGVVTLEMDVVVTADGQVVVSHDPWFAHEICLLPDGREIAPEEERSYRIFDMPYEDVARYDCGSLGHPRFPEQRKMEAKKPLLTEVIAAAEKYAAESGRPLPFYNIETKSTPRGDSLFHPTPDVFAQAVVDVVRAEGIGKRTTIQSFDVRTLQYLEGKYPELRLALLVENNWGPEENLKQLGFTPHIYSPEYTLVDAKLVQYCKERKMQLIPWTVNDPEHMRILIELGVDGIISDYPNRFSNL